MAEADRLTVLALDGLEPREVPVSWSPRLLRLFVDLEKHSGAGRVLMAAPAAKAERWRREGFASPAEWLAAQQGCSAGRARDDLATSERLDGLDETKAALRSGMLSPDQAGAVSDAALVNPDAERDLLDTARRESLRGLKDEAARRKAEVEDLEHRAERIRRKRSCRAWVDRDGAWNLHALGPVEGGSAFEVAWNRLVAEQFEAARIAGRREGRDQYAFDALMEMGARPGRVGTPDDAATDGDAVGSGDAGPPSRRSTPSRENLRHLGLIRADFEALVRGAVEGGEVCEIAGLGSIPVSTARSLLGDSILKLVITRGVDVVNVTHLGRGPTTAQLVALRWAQPGCIVEGCHRTQRLDIDHRHPWARQQVTRLCNLDPLCTHHHDLKTRSGWALVDGTGRRPMVPPDDHRHPGRAERSRGAPSSGSRRSPTADPSSEVPSPGHAIHGAGQSTLVGDVA